MNSLILHQEPQHCHYAFSREQFLSNDLYDKPTDNCQWGHSTYYLLNKCGNERKVRNRTIILHIEENRLVLSKCLKRSYFWLVQVTWSRIEAFCMELLLFPSETRGWLDVKLLWNYWRMNNSFKMMATVNLVSRMSDDNYDYSQ